MQDNHIRFSCHGWLDVISHVFCRCSWKWFYNPKTLNELFKLRLGIFLIIESPTIATVFFSFPVDFTPSMWCGWWRKLSLGCSVISLPLLLLAELSRASDWFSFDSLIASWLLIPELLLLSSCIWIDLSIESIYFFFLFEDSRHFYKKIGSNLWLLVPTMLL